MAKDDWQLCQELSRFLYSLDHTGAILQTCLAEADALPPAYAAKGSSASSLHPPIQRTTSAHVIAADAAGKALSPAKVSSTSAAFQRTGETARAMHYRMASSSGLGLGSLLSRVGTPPNDIFRHPRRSVSGTSIAESPEEETLGRRGLVAEGEREADDDL